MKILNKYTYLLIGILVLISIVVLAIMPRFETQEFNPDRIEEISEGVTTTTQSSETSETNNQENNSPSTTSEISEI